MLHEPVLAALIPIGCHPFIALILTVMVVGVIVYLAVMVVGWAEFIADRFKAWAIKLIYILGGAYCVLLALWVIFGIRIFGNIPLSMVC